MAKTGMIIDGVMGSQCIDSSGEILDVEGADISDLEEGRGVLNYEHKGAEDKDSNGQEIVGKIITAKKIFKESDCDNARERAYWQKVKNPFIYGVCRLYDGAGHEGAKALAAQIRDHHANNEPILVRFSVEGSTLEKDGNVLKRSVIRRVALTLKPCNRTADSGLIEDPNAPQGFDKQPVQRVNDILAGLADDAKKMEHEHPMYQKLGGVHEHEYMEFDDDGRRDLVKALVKLKVIKKALSAGGGDVAPSQLSGGAALQREDLVKFKTKAMKTLKSFLDKNFEFTRSQILDTLKQELPEASDEFLGHFANIAEDYKLKLRKSQDSSIPSMKALRPHVSDQECYVHAEALAEKFPKLKFHGGFFIRDDGTPADHAWVQTPEGTIIDTTYSQFNPKTKVGIFKKDHPIVKRYRSYEEHHNPNCLHQELGVKWPCEVTGCDYKGLKKKDEEGDYPKLNPKLPGVQETRVNREAEPKGVVPPSPAGGVEMKPGGKLMLQRSGTKGRPRIGLQQHFPDDPLYHALLKPDEGLDAGTIDADTHATIIKTIHDPWHRAMANWMPLNAALAKGKVPNGILAKSTIFAAMSPNTSVPNQERYYGYYMDLLNEGKVDPFKPISEEALKEFTARSSSGELPQWNREYYEAHPPDNLGGRIDEDPDKGELPQLMGLRGSHLMFPYLQHLTAKYKDDTQGIAAELMDLKAEHFRYNDARRTAGYQGKEFTRPAPEHPHIRGYGPKLTRYILGMMGGGNMIVPDQHMIRSTFDLHLENNTDILDKLQTKIMVHPRNEKLLRAIDHNFFVKHPAVKHVLETFPKHFAGREQQAIFPAFWLHWLTIGHYDRMRGRPSMAFNADTDHSVFWDSVRDEMIKHGLNPHPMIEGRVVDDPQGTEDESFNFGENLGKAEIHHGINPWPRHHAVNDQPVWLKAAGVVSALRQRWGETPAMLAFFSHVMPILMDAEVPVPPVVHRPHAAYNPNLLRAESLLINLKKAVSEASGDHPALAELAPQIHHVYMLKPGQDLKIRRHPAGRFTTAGGHVNILEDYHGILGSSLTEGQIDPTRQKQIENLYSHPKYDVATLAQIRDGQRPELWNFVAKPAQTKPSPSFDFYRIGAHPDDPQFQQEHPDHLTFVAGEAHLNGHPLNRQQTQALLQHVKNGHAVVRYKKDNAEAIRKMEQIFDDLLKADDPNQATAVHNALGRLEQLVAEGKLEPHHVDALRQHAFKDPMTGHVMGNKFAYEDFKNRSDSRGGIHMVMDGNDFKSVNDRFGHDVGDSAIRAMGSAMRSAMDEAAPGEGKLFRTGGDEFAAHFPTHEHAARFARALRHHLEQVTPIQGTHKLSMGIGIGTSPGSADTALYEAKKQKYHPEGMTDPDSRKWTSKYAPGTAPNFAHSLVPGFEGPVPLDHSQLQIKPPPMPAPRPEEPAPVVHTPSVANVPPQPSGKVQHPGN